MGEPPGQPRLVSRQTQCLARRVGHEAPWKGSIELLGAPINTSRANQKCAGSRSSPFMMRALKQTAWQNHTCHLSPAVVIVK